MNSLFLRLLQRRLKVFTKASHVNEELNDDVIEEQERASTDDVLYVNGVSMFMVCPC